MALTEAHCCRLLGLSAAATLDETRSAYRRIARQMHPDRAGGDGDHFKEITAAYNWLVVRRSAPMADEARPERTRRSGADDATRRARARRAWQHARNQEARQARAAAHAARAEADLAAERARIQAEQARAARQRARAAKGKARAAERARVETRWDEDFTDAWEAWCKTAERYHAQSGAVDGGGPDAAADEPKPWSPRALDPEASRGAEPTSIFGRMRQGLRRVTRRAALDRVGCDVSLRLPVDLDLLMNGGTRTLAITRAAACPSCRGAGDASCVCGGDGRVKLRETVKVTVPPGARPGARLRLEGKGTAGLDGAPDGDLLLLLDPEPVAGFRVDGLDLHGQVVVSRRLAGGGGAVAVDLPRGKVKLNVPPGSGAGDRFRLRGQGMPSWGCAERGDLFLSVVIR